MLQMLLLTQHMQRCVLQSNSGSSRGCFTAAAAAQCSSGGSICSCRRWMQQRRQQRRRQQQQQLAAGMRPCSRLLLLPLQHLRLLLLVG
jgi:hypothetical protein